MSDKSEGISGACLSLPSFNDNVVALVTDSRKKNLLHQLISRELLPLWKGILPVAISITVQPTLQIST